MTKRTLLLALAVTLLAAACSSAPAAELDTGEGLRFVPAVVDSPKDVGSSPSIVLDAEGRPFIAYLGFEQVLEEGQIADDRALHLPAVPNVLFATTSADGYWQLGEVAWNREALQFPSGDPNLQTRGEAPGEVDPPAPNASVAAFTDAKGTIHLAWSDAKGLRYANNDGGAFLAEDVALGVTSGVSITATRTGVPWISYYKGQNLVQAATIVDGKWQSRVVGKADICAECPAARTAIAALADGAGVAYTDGDSPILAVLGEDAGEVETRIVAPGAGGWGISLASDDRGDAVMAFYTATGGVHIAHGPADGPFDLSEIAAEPTGGAGSVFGWGTGVAPTEEGHAFVTWHDVAEDVVALARVDGGKAERIETQGTVGGAEPSITMSAEGEPMIAWYDAVNHDLAAGVLTEAEEVPIAIPSPSPVAEEGPAPLPEAECAPTVLTVGAPVGASSSGFDPTCLAAKADKPFTITFDNLDVGVPHNVAVFTDETASDPVFANTEPITEGTADYDIDPLEAGQYFFNCFFHPTTMTGVLVIE